MAELIVICVTVIICVLILVAGIINVAEKRTEGYAARKALEILTGLMNKNDSKSEKE